MQKEAAAYEQGASQNVLQMFTLFGDTGRQFEIVVSLSCRGPVTWLPTIPIGV